jgi:glycine/D-amino acid oxidase-like deaminating enzyme
MTNLRADVCICGAGPAGFVAAIAAARTGARTVLLEKNGFAGGLATAGLVGPISKFSFGGRRVVGGIPLEFVERLHARGGAILDLPSGNVPFDAELYKLVAQETLAEAGVLILFHATVHGAEFGDDDALRQVRAVSEGTPVMVEAACFVDCTGTGSLLATRADLWQRRNEPDSTQPLSLVFILGGVDTSQTTVRMAEDGTKYAHPVLRAALASAVEEQLISSFGGPWAVWGSVMRDGQVSVNCTRYGGDVTDPLDFSRAEATMRAEILPIIDVFRRADPAFSQCFLQQTATTAGYRESRELVAAYQLTGDDVFSGREFPDTIAFGAHPIDRHLPGSSGQNVQFLTAPYRIPYRCLASARCPNLLAAGALAAADPVAFATLRVQAQCMATGQAAGTAAAIGATSGTAVAELDQDELRRRLTAQNAIV